MRYLATAALCGTLLLAGCSQDMPSAPAEPDPEASAALRCITPGFPLKLALAQIVGTRTSPGLYPASRPRPLALALARVAEIAALWTLCKPAQAQAKVATHTTILLDDYRAGRLVGGTSEATATRVVAHTNTMWQGVGLQAPNIPVFPGTGTDFGFGLFTPGQELLVQTGSQNGAVRIPSNGFTETTLITIVQRATDPNPFEGTAENVFPPFYEIVASNASNTHYLANGTSAIVGFCVDDELFPAILSMADPAIAHIAVPEGTNPGGFEILDDASTAGLGLDCPTPEGFGSLFDGGLKGFASTAPRLLRTAAASLFLPTRAEAAASALGKTGLGGLARSLSPFGVVDRAGEEVGSLFHLDPEFSSEPVSNTVTRRVQLVSGESSVEGAEVTFTTEDGFLGNETGQQVVTTDADGQATVSWTLPEFPSVYTLTASVPGSSISFTVAGANDGQLTPLSCELEDRIRSLNSNKPVTVTFSNGFSTGGPSITTFWLDYSGQRVFYNSLNPGQSYEQGTFVTHPWIVITPDDPENPDDSEECYGIFLPLSPDEGTFGGTVTISPTF
ncbi:MAG: hypothetical protein H0W29_09220 [Gemmatimonadales bacterium]|nr:hypothetical protein [Gemmatimonadales bacterium]